MKRYFSMIAILFAMNIAMLAQDDITSSIEVEDTIADDYKLPFLEQKRVTEFMGIPIDGTKRDVMKQLRKKGFRRSFTMSGLLEGEFNGHKVYVSVATNKNKVWRIMLLDAVAIDESSIKNRFNNLCYQFKSNSKYDPLKNIDNFIIPDDENISYNMIVNNKRYEASFCQCLDFNPDFLRYMYKNEDKMTEEDINKRRSMASKYWNYLVYNHVWFIIHKEEYKPEYRIVMYYDNGYNQPDGEDL